MTFADVKGTRLHYEFDGPATRPVIVLVNSLGSTLRMWNKILPALTADYRVLRYDVRGHGQSGVPASPYTIEGLAADLVDLLDQLHIGRFHLCGLSLGGLIGMWLGVHHPQRIGGLILANTAARIGTAQGWNERIAAVMQHGMASITPAILARWFTAGYLQDHPDEMSTILEMLKSTPPEGYIGCCCALREADLRNQIPTIRASCLIITGAHDPATPPDDGRALHAALSQSQYVELDAAHLSAWERSQEFQQAVLQFLNEEGENHE